jgi:predicted CopG family antitoxin
MCMQTTCMSRNLNLYVEAVAALEAHRRGRESFSKVVKRVVPPPIRTFADLERHLANVEGPLFSGFDRLEKLIERKHKANRAR